MSRRLTIAPCTEDGDDVAAEATYRGGIAAGDGYCHHNLGVLPEGLGATAEAEGQFRFGDAAGDEKTTCALRARSDAGSR